MKKKIWIPILLLVLLAVGVTGSVVFGKYIFKEDESHTFKSALYYFESDRLDVDCPEYIITGSGNSFTVANGWNNDNCSNMDILYDLQFYYYDTEIAEFAEAEDAAEKDVCLTAVDGTLVSKSYDVAPLTVSEKTYNKVKVVATCKTFKTDPLSAVFEFRYAPYSVKYQYDDVGHAISILLATNGDAGDYTFHWAAGVLPYTTDPNELITEALQSNTEELQLTCTGLARYTNYAKIYFVITDAGKIADLQNAATDSEKDELLRAYAYITHS